MKNPRNTNYLGWGKMSRKKFNPNAQVFHYNNNARVQVENEQNNIDNDSSKARSKPRGSRSIDPYTSPT